MEALLPWQQYLFIFVLTSSSSLSPQFSQTSRSTRSAVLNLCQDCSSAYLLGLTQTRKLSFSNEDFFAHTRASDELCVKNVAVVCVRVISMLSWQRTKARIHLRVWPEFANKARLAHTQSNSHTNSTALSGAGKVNFPHFYRFFALNEFQTLSLVAVAIGSWWQEKG